MSNEQPPRGALRRGLSTGRLEAFSDGVYAIAITLLVLDIAVPPHSEPNLLSAVAHLYLGIALFYIIPFRSFGRINRFRRSRARRPVRRGGTDHQGEGS